ncbi:MAG: methyltransferase [Pseudomonadota bacterium]
MPLRHFVLALRNRLLTSQRFQRAAGAFWPTRLIARRRALELFNIVAGFTYSQTLYACVELGLFSRLAAGPQRGQRIAADIGLDDDATHALLNAAVALRLLERVGAQEYGLGVLGAAMVDNAGVEGMVRHHAYFYRDMADPLALLKQRSADTAMAAYWPYADAAADSATDEQAVARYTALMSASQPMIYDQVHAAYPFTGHRHLLDVGGGNGTFLAATAARAPELELSLFDMPPVARLAEAHLADAGLAKRVRVCPGDFTRDPLPTGADLVSLVRVLHDHDDDVVAALLKRVHAALPPGGVVLVAEPLADTEGAPQMGSVYFAFYLRAMGSGRPRRFDELRTLLTTAGFTAVRRHATPIPMLASVISAKRSN